MILALKLALAASILALPAASANGQTLRFSAQGDVGTLDPYGLNETFTLGFQGNIYEGLIARGPNLAMEPALAERWEIVEPTRWRFYLRHGVRFHDGSPFTAADVLYSAERVRKEGSALRSRLAGVSEVIEVDDHTVDFITGRPNPVLPAEWDTWYVVSRRWAEANGAADPAGIKTSRSAFASRNANGTGPFRLVSREPDAKTVAERFEGWWGKAPTNLEQVVFRPIATDATRVAALLSGEMDLILSLPTQDIERIAHSPGMRALTGPELRTMFLGFDQTRNELRRSSVKGANPFKDRKVRLAVYQAIDVEAIQKKVMRGQSTPAATLVGPGIFGFVPKLRRHSFDPDSAKRLLAEAGYPDGFTLGMDCPNDRYVNDAAICQAIAGMLAKIGIKIELDVQTKTLYFARVLAEGGYDTSFYLLGWTPNTFDSWNAIYNVVRTRDPVTGAGAYNLGGYSNPKIDVLSDLIATEADPDRRRDLIAEVWQILHDDVGYIPLHQQALAWGMRDGVEVVQRPDNQLLWRWVVMR